jgi:uncharacterized membrane protein YfcA
MFVVGLALSILIGLSLGLLGGGGSILTVPVIHYVMGVETHAAIAASLAVVGTTSIAALIPHARARRVQWRTGATFGVAAMIGAYFAGSIAKHIPPAILMAAFGIMMLVTAVAMLRKKPPKDGDTRKERASLGLILIEGLVVGAVTGLVGAGGGFLVVPALVLLGGLPIAEAIGTSLLVIAMKSFAAFAGSASDVTLDPKILVSVSIMAVLGSILGGWVSGKIPAARLQGLFGWFIVVMAVFVLGQEIPRALGYTVDLSVDWPWVFGPVLVTILIAIGVSARTRLTVPPSAPAAVAVGAD